MHLVFALLLCSLGTAAQAQNPGPIVFSELMWMGSSASSSDEWIELYNRSDAQVDLVNWTIVRLTKDGEEVMLQIQEGEIPAHATFLISNYSSDDSRSRLAVQPQLVDPAISLPNTKLQLRLYNGDPEKGAKLIDTADDGSGAPLAGDNKLKRAMVRIAIDQDGSLSTSWSTAQEAIGWDEEAVERGTPGSVPDHLQTHRTMEHSATTQVRPMAWAIIKSNMANR